MESRRARRRMIVFLESHAVTLLTRPQNALQFAQAKEAAKRHKEQERFTVSFPCVRVFPLAQLLRTANCPSSLTVHWGANAEVFRTASAGLRAADGDRP